MNSEILEYEIETAKNILAGWSEKVKARSEVLESYWWTSLPENDGISHRCFCLQYVGQTYPHFLVKVSFGPYGKTDVFAIWKVLTKEPEKGLSAVDVPIVIRSLTGFQHVATKVQWFLFNRRYIHTREAEKLREEMGAIQ